MAKRDVDLVIRARNEASKAIDQITAALQDFAGAQTEISQGAGKTKTTLAELGTSLKQLQQALGGSASQKVAQDLGKAREAVQRLGQQIEQTTGEAIGFQREYLKAGRSLEQLRQESTQVAAQLKAQTAALNESRGVQKALNAEVGNAEKARARLVTADARLTKQIEAQIGRVAEARTKYAALKAELAGVDQPTKRLRSSFDAAGRAVSRSVAGLDALRAKQRETQQAIRGTDSALAGFNAKVGQQAAVQERVSAAVDRLRERQTALKSVIDAAASGQQKLGQAARDAGTELTRQDQALAQATDELRKLEGAADSTGAAMRTLSGEARASALQAFGAQRKAVQGARQEWTQAQERVKALAAEMRATKQPTAEMAAAFEKAQAAARAAKTNFEAQREVLLRLREVLRQGEGGVLGLSQRFDALNASLGRAKGAVGTHTAAAKVAAQADRELAQAAERAAGGTGRLAASARATGDAMHRGAAGANSFSAALRQFYGNSRTALSFTQRLRSEVLALASAYLGFFAVFRGVSSVVDAFRTLEAAQNRLGAIFSQDEGMVAREIDFLRREADRLGISFQVLSDQYSKFAVAADTANFSNEAIRKTFISVAEAGRVNKLSIEQLNGIFLALQQIISKGKVQSEELRRQLGDRLPGAFQIMASALNVTTAELDRMLKAGEVVADQDTLLAFAGELDKRFGAQLPQSLKATTTEIGRFQNSLFEAGLAVAQGGFIDAFTDLLRDLNETLKSADFRAFLDNISGGLANLTDLLGLFVQNWELVVIAATAFVATRLAPFVVALAVAFQGLVGNAARAAATLTLVANTARSSASASAAAATAVRGLTAALRVLLSSTGIGLVVSAIGVAIGAWATRADEATEAMVAHEKVVQRITAEYEKANGEQAAFSKGLADISLTQAKARLKTFLDELNAGFDSLGTKLREGTVGLGPLRAQTIGPFEDLIAQAKAGEITVEELKTRFEELATAGSAIRGDLLVALLDTIDTLDPLARQAGEASDVVKTLSGDMDAAARVANDLGGAADKAAGDFEKYSEAMEKLRKAVPEVADGMERLKEASEIHDAVDMALKFAENAQQAADAVAAWNAALDALAEKDLANVLSGKGAAAGFAERTLQLEGVGRGGGTSTAQDEGVLGGFIESTWLKLFRKHFPDEAAKRTEQQILDLRKERGLVLQMIELLAQENARTLHFFGEDVNDISLRLAHLLGPTGALQVLRAPADADLSGILPPEFIDANQGLLGGGRTAGELLEITREQMGVSEQEFAIRQEIARVDKDRAEELRKQREATEATLADGEFQIGQQRLINAEKEREAAIEDAVRAAKQENKNITDEQLAQVREQAAALFDLQNINAEIEKQQKAAADAEREVNDLLSIRVALTEQLKLLEEQGAPNERIIATRNGIEEINEQLLTAIDRAIALFEALGGSAADATIAKLQTLKLTLADTGDRALLDFKKVGDLMASGLTNAFDKFAQAVASGEKATKALADAFRQFAADFLRQIAQMIIKQLILNALKSVGFPGFGASVGHSGGIVGSLNRRRTVNPAVFYNAMRYHGGGVAGLKPNEVPIIAEKGEELVTSDDPRHRKNAGVGGAGSDTKSVKVVNAFDAPSFLEEAMQSARGEDVILNFLRANQSAVKSAIGG